MLTTKEIVNPYYERDKKVHELRKTGLTLAEIGEQFSVSRERIRQILLVKPKPIFEFARWKKDNWLIAAQANRRTCYICRESITGGKFCKKCIEENKLNVGGRDLVRGTVRGRDNNTCQVCGYKWTGKEKKRLDIHHLGGDCGKYSRGYDKINKAHKLITVCHKCHYNLIDHKQNGKKKPL